MRVGKSIHNLPEDDDQCGWTETLPPLPPARRLASAEQADAVVIGAGFTGLGVARQLGLVRPDWRVIVVDAQRVSQGSAGRGSGFVVDLSDLTAKMTPTDRLRHVRVARSGIEDLRTLVRTHQIDCAWDETGWIRAAAGEEGRKSLHVWPEWCEPAGISFQWLDAQQLADITGTEFYRIGLRMPGYPLVQMAALIRGLAAHLPSSVDLYENSPVTSIESKNGIHLQAGEGSIASDRLFLCTNGYSHALSKHLARRVLPIYTFGGLSRVLSEGEQEALGGEREWGLLAMDPMGSSLRRTRDQRILIRNTIHYTKKLKIEEARKQKVLPSLHHALYRRFPALSGLDFEYVWSGLTSSTLNRQPIFGEVESNIFTAAGYSGAGIAMGSAMGRLLADLAMGVDSDLLRDLQALPKVKIMPPEPFRSLGARWTFSRMNAQGQSYI